MPLKTITLLVASTISLSACVPLERNPDDTCGLAVMNHYKGASFGKFIIELRKKVPEILKHHGSKDFAINIYDLNEKTKEQPKTVLASSS